jgi:diguanylate cyclase (GGDEF)-like protein/PAS domain S-box-containing protein
LTEVLEHSPDCVLQTDALGVITYLNPAARRMLGCAQDLSRQLKFADLLAEEVRQQLADVIVPALAARGVWVGEIALRLGERFKVPFSLTALLHRSADGRAVRYSAVMRDISADVQVRQQIKRQNDILGAITEALPATVVIVDSRGRYVFVNSAFERYVGLDASNILGRTAAEVLGAEEVARRKPYMLKAFGGEAVDFVLDYAGEQGTTYLALNCIPLKLDGLMDGFVGISQDITAQRREQARLSDLAERDALTGLLNRTGLAQRFERTLWRGEGADLALLYIDLDHFKPVNDELGHQAGDHLLQMFAQRLGEVVRSSDTVARLGGDEFVILLPGAGNNGAAEAVARKVLAAASRPFDIDGHSVCVSASIGVAALAHPDEGLRELLARADMLLYRAKAAGRAGLERQDCPAERTTVE